MDNASNNDTFINEYYKLNQPLVANAMTYYIRCFPHIINIVCQTTIKALDTNASDDDAENANNDIANDQVPTGLLAKVRALIRTIRASGQHQAALTGTIEQGNVLKWWSNLKGETIEIKPRRLLLDVRTRWDSTFQMLCRFYDLKQVCRHLISLLISSNSNTLN